jgi:predicted permease
MEDVNVMPRLVPLVHRAGPTFERFAADVRFASRLLRRSPGFTVVAILSIAVGIGSTTTAFGLLDAVLLHSMPYRAVDRVVMVWRQNASAGQDRVTMSSGDYVDYATQTRSFLITGVARGLNTTAELAGEPIALSAVQVTPSLFETLGITPFRGRGFGEGDAENTRVAIITHEFWQRALSADKKVIGRELTLRTGIGASGGSASVDGRYTIVGVLPPDARIPYRSADIWIPFRVTSERGLRDNRGLLMFARLRQGVSIAQASADVAAVTADIAARFPSQMRGQSSWLVSLRSEDVGDVTPTVILVMTSVALLTLIVCANLGNMVLSRLTDRHRELVLRRAVGADDSRIVAQLFAEAIVLASAGAAAGVLLALWLTRLLAVSGPVTVSRIAAVHVGDRALLIAVGASILMSLVFGLVPAMRVSQISASNLSLRSDNASPSSSLREWLVGAQVALAFIVLAGTALVIVSAISLGRATLGYKPQNVLTFQISLPRDAYFDPVVRTRFTADMLSRLRNLPAVIAAGGVNVLPQIDADPSISFTIDRQGSNDPRVTLSARYRAATPGYFAAMRIPLLKGRDFSDADQRRRAVVVSQSFQERHFPNQDPIGRRIRLLVPGLDTIDLPIVGVVGDVRQWIETTPNPTIYLMNLGQSSFTVAIRTATNPAALAPMALRVVRDTDPQQPIFDVATMEVRLARGQGLSFTRFRTLLMIVLGFIALNLATLGIYAVVRHSVGSRTKELAIRTALGATRGAIVTMVLSASLRSVMAGVATGFVASVFGSKLVTATLYGVAGIEISVLIGVAMLLSLLAIAAAVEPAWRAAGLDPLGALRTS